MRFAEQKLKQPYTKSKLLYSGHQIQPFQPSIIVIQFDNPHQIRLNWKFICIKWFSDNRIEGSKKKTIWSFYK